MSLDRPDVAGSVWPSSVSIQEHDHVPSMAMPAIPGQLTAARPQQPPQQHPQQRSVPRVSSTPIASSIGSGAGSGCNLAVGGPAGGVPVSATQQQQQQQQQPMPAGMQVSAGLPASSAMLDALPSMDLVGDLGADLCAMPNGLDCLTDMNGLTGLGEGSGDLGGLGGGGIGGGLNGDVTSLFGSDAGLPGGAEPAPAPPLPASGVGRLPTSPANYNVVSALRDHRLTNSDWSCCATSMAVPVILQSVCVMQRRVPALPLLMSRGRSFLERASLAVNLQPLPPG